MALVLIPALAFAMLEKSDVWSAFYYSDYQEESESALEERADAELDYDPEDLLAMQDGRVDAQLAALAPQRRGQVDLYVVAMAGDGAEDVFRNEAELATEVFDARFGTAGRSLSLINHVDTLPQLPLATRRNLLRTLEGIGRIIDPAEDIVLVFMTSHGSEDHDWLVRLGDVTLTQITPDDVLEAYDNAGIRWRVAIVSACYSGGYVDALASPTSLVITSARTDRTSFGCGADADLTYFGRAYLAEALNQSTDLSAAFDIARRHIQQRERADGFESSEPQISNGASIAAQLARWRDQQPGSVSR
ncbi:MAG TPA: C13 family peptidase [Pseudomonadota bacterium]|nr:C13 family peptidase [Pseudomonadota bacterium]